MKPVVLLIAIYSLIIHQASKDHAVKRYNNRADKSIRISSNLPQIDRKAITDNTSYNSGLITSPAFLSNKAVGTHQRAKSEFIWPEQAEIKYQFSPAYYPFQ